MEGTVLVWGFLSCALLPRSLGVFMSYPVSYVIIMHLCRFVNWIPTAFWFSHFKRTTEITCCLVTVGWKEIMHYNHKRSLASRQQTPASSPRSKSFTLKLTWSSNPNHPAFAPLPRHTNSTRGDIIRRGLSLPWNTVFCVKVGNEVRGEVANALGDFTWNLGTLEEWYGR